MSSLSVIQKENEEETVFDLDVPLWEPPDPKTIQSCIYKDLCLREEKTKQEEEWSMQMICTQEWFIRCSWINKLLFIELLCESVSAMFVLESVLSTIDSIFSKDVMESLSHDSTNFAYDKIPTDDNRALDEGELQAAMKDSFSWFINQCCRDQIRVILRLLRLGGGGLMFMAYKLIRKIHQKRQATVKEMTPEKRSEKTEETRQEDDVTSSTTRSFESNSMKDLAIKKQKQLEKRQAELLRYQQMRGLTENVGNERKNEETVDYLQLLPIWLNRKIMSYIDEKTLLGLKKVGKYWSKMIDESINEKSGRKAINAKINKIIGIKADKEVKSEEEVQEEEGEMEELEFIQPLGAKDLINAKNENEKDLAKMSEFYNYIFSKKCTINTLDSSYHPERCAACECSILACSTPNNTIHFYSLKTGARFDFLIFGLESDVTCIALHEDKTHIFIGCLDGSLISKDFRTNNTSFELKGHKKRILSIVTTATNFLSASKDNTIRYFQLWSGVCLLCFDLNTEFNISSVLLRNDKQYLTAIGTEDGFLVLANINAKRILAKVKLHVDEIRQLAHDGHLLITGSAKGNIRIWNMNHIEHGHPNLQPYYNINVRSPVTSLKFYKNQILSGCGNGTVKVISLATGEISKSLKISSQTPITGVDVREDKPFMRVIIWHEEGIEIRTFSLQKPPPKKISVEKDNVKSKQKARQDWRKEEMSEEIPDDRVAKIWEAIDSLPKAHKRTYEGSKNPLKDRICTLSLLRTQRPKPPQIKTDVFSEMFNAIPSRPGNFLLSTFPRNKRPNFK